MDLAEDTLDLQVGDWIIWQGEEIQAAEDTFVSPGMVGKVKLFTVEDIAK